MPIKKQDMTIAELQQAGTEKVISDAIRNYEEVKQTLKLIQSIDGDTTVAELVCKQGISYWQEHFALNVGYSILRCIENGVTEISLPALPDAEED